MACPGATGGAALVPVRNTNRDCCPSASGWVFCTFCAAAEALGFRVFVFFHLFVLGTFYFMFCTLINSMVLHTANDAAMRTIHCVREVYDKGAPPLLQLRVRATLPSGRPIPHRTSFVHR